MSCQLEGNGANLEPSILGRGLLDMQLGLGDGQSAGSGLEWVCSSLPIVVSTAAVAAAAVVFDRVRVD